MEEEIRFTIKEQCELREAQMTIRMRKGLCGTHVAAIKLPIEATNNAPKNGKNKEVVVFFKGRRLQIESSACLRHETV